MNRQVSPIPTASMQLALECIERLNLPKQVVAAINLAEFGNQNEIFYQDYPSLFTPAFVEPGGRQLQVIAAAGLLYYRSVISLDSVLDGDFEEPGSKFNEKLSALAMSVCQELSIKLLSSVFSREDPFWKKWNRRRNEYLTAYFLEQKLSRQPTFNDKTYAIIATNKAAFGRVAIDCLRELSGREYESIYKLLLDAYWDYSYGLQLMDDFQDFTSDGATGQLNYFQSKLTELLRDRGTAISNAAARKKEMYVTGIAEKGLAKAALHFAKAERYLEGVGSPIKFKKVIQSALANVARIREQIYQYFAIVSTKSILHDQYRADTYNEIEVRCNTQYPGATGIALAYILDQANRHFPEIKHLMFLGASEGFNNSTNVHVGDVFQRAMLLDALQTYAEASPPNESIQRLISDETNYLLAQRLKGDVEGWSYFPTVKEIAPDIDDLGQIMQCLANGGHRDTLKATCFPLIDFLVKNNFDTTAGAYETWLVPREDRTANQCTQDNFNRTKWGTGPDPEVIANLIHGVALSQYSLPSSQYTSCLDYLVKSQAEDGSWLSRWYFGPYYGTYVVARALQPTKVGAGARQKARDYLLSRQLANGSYEDNLLHTALGSLALHHCSEPEDAEALQARMATKAFLNKWLLESDALPPPTPFIIPKAGLPFGSSTLEMGFIIKALSK